jgi:dihydroorotase
MGATVGGVPAPDDGGMIRTFQLVSETGLRIGVHAENNPIMDYFTEKLKAEGRTDPLAHVEARPNVAEAEAIQRAILFAAETGCKLHIYHMSSKDGVQLLKAAKERGVDVSAETCPHYLLLDSSYMKKVGSILKMNPPVRSAENGEALWKGLSDGTVEVIATDHSPHTLEEKTNDNIWEAIPGFTGVETSVPLMLTQVNEGRLSLNAYVKLASENPARLFNLYPRKGTIQIGTDADFTIVDMEREGALSSEKLHSKTKVTPFDGWKVKGVPIYTIVRGKVVMKEGEIVGKPQGEHIKAVI